MTSFVWLKPSPICPKYEYGLWHLTVPPAITAQECSVCWPSLLQLNCFTLLNPRTTFGASNDRQHSATACAVTAQLLCATALTETAPVSFGTSVGVSTLP